MCVCTLVFAFVLMGYCSKSCIFKISKQVIINACIVLLIHGFEFIKRYLLIVCDSDIYGVSVFFSRIWINHIAEIVLQDFRLAADSETGQDLVRTCSVSFCLKFSKYSLCIGLLSY